jgi:NAD-dependent dihydropyrimidine dehydrogenase PreA subunit
MCGECTEPGGKFCPNDLFYIGKIKKDGKEEDVVMFNFKEIRKCQGCLRCESSCRVSAINPIKFND